MRRTGEQPPGKFVWADLFTTSGCVSDGYVSESVYYGPHHRDPWFHDNPWMDGRRRGYREEPRASGSVNVSISPPRPREDSLHPSRVNGPLRTRVEPDVFRGGGGRSPLW